MSQMSSSSHFQSQESSRIIVPIVKFSCSLTPYGNTIKGPPWTHYSRSDLEFIIQKVQGRNWQGQNEVRMLMKVVAGAEFLEEQDLGELAGIARDFGEAPGVEFPVRVVVKAPVLALRYPKSTHNIRRLQVRFRDEADFIKILDILRDLGLPTTDCVTSAPSFQSYSPSSVDSSTPCSMDRGGSSFSGTVQPLPPGHVLASFQKSNTLGDIRFRIPDRPNTSSPSYHRSSSTISSRSSIPFSRPQSSTSISTFMSQSKPSIEALKNSQSLYASQLGKVEPLPMVMQALDSSVSLQNHQSSIYPRCNSQRQIIEEQEETLSASPFFPPQPGSMFSNSPTLSTPQSNQDKYTNYEYGDAQPLDRRPISLPSEHDSYFNLTLPPKRELPFLKPKDTAKPQTSPIDIQPSISDPSTSLKKSHDEISASASSAIKTITPIKKPTKKRAASRKSSVVPVQKPAGLSIEDQPAPKMGQPMQDDEPSPLAAKTVGSLSATNPMSTSSQLLSKATTTKKRPASTDSSQTNKRPKMVNKTTQTQTLSGRDHTIALKPSQIASTSDASTNTSVVSSAPPLIHQNDLDLFVSMRGNSSRIELPPNYVKAPDEARHKMLNEFICENLENEHFLKLCEDMDVSWRRMGLGR